MALTLTYRRFGCKKKPPLFVLHGLLGSSRSWLATTKDLSIHFEVFLVDLRNHGDSPHASEMSYAALSDDILQTMDSLSLKKTTILGHSLGGKVAMYLATNYPNRVAGLIIVDIAPKQYQPHYTQELKAMMAIDLSKLNSRKDADVILSDAVKDCSFRQFLLTNLDRNQHNQYFSWKANIPALLASQKNMAENPVGDNRQYKGSTLFIQGGQSDFIQPEDHVTIAEHFPNSSIRLIQRSGHNPHVDAMVDFAHFVTGFAERLAFKG